MSYIYAIYKHHVGALEFRANRLLGLYSFSVLSLTAYVMALFAVSSRWAPIDVQYVAAVLGTSLVFVSLTFLLRSRFQALVDRHIFGIRHSPDEVIELVSERIPTAFDRSALARVLTEEILPSLLIRQSALHLLERPPENGLETLYEQGVPPDEPPTRGRAARPARAERPLPPPAAPRLVALRLGAAGHAAHRPGRDDRRLAARPARSGRPLPGRGDPPPHHRRQPDRAHGGEHPPLRAGAAGDRPAQGRRGGDPAQRGALPHPVRSHPRRASRSSATARSWRSTTPCSPSSATSPGS